MENENIVTLQFKLTRDKALLLLAFFFLCWNPGPLGSETLQLTTYYPAPYGGYVSLLTTGQTLLARDAGNVLVGMTTESAPATQKLDVNGSIRASGETTGTLASGSGQFRAIAGSYGAMIRNDGADTYIPLMTRAGDQYGSWNALRPLRVNNATGDVFLANSQASFEHATGSLNGLCRLQNYAVGARQPCNANEYVMTWYGNGTSTCGMLFKGGAMENPANWSQQVCVGADRAGTMLCCRIRNF